MTLTSHLSTPKKKTMKTTTLAALGLAATLGLAACGSTHAATTTAPATTAAPATTLPPTTTTTVPIAHYAAQFKADIAKVNTAGAALDPYSTFDVPTKVLNTFAGVLLTCSRHLQTQQWPAADTADIHSLVSAIDLWAAGMLNGQASNSQATAASGAAEVVQGELGLPTNLAG